VYCSEQNKVSENWLTLAKAVPESREMERGCHLHCGVHNMALSNYGLVCCCTAYSILRNDSGGTDQCLLFWEFSEILNYYCPVLTVRVPNYCCEFQQPGPQTIFPRKSLIFKL